MTICWSVWWFSTELANTSRRHLALAEGLPSHGAVIAIFRDQSLDREDFAIDISTMVRHSLVIRLSGIPCGRTSSGEGWVIFIEMGYPDSRKADPTNRPQDYFRPEDTGSNVPPHRGKIGSCWR